ncbi:MAG: transporter substrate-binding domain-containing protein [Clostridia bacterium]|nr:transporter substrate-binding domain-containing protein [Clostridia bacterium]
MKKFVKLFALALAICTLLCCVGCVSDESTVKTYEDIKAAGKIVIATSPDFPPFESIEGGEVVGIEIDILNHIAKKWGITLDIQQVNFDAVLPGVQAGKYDVGVSGITIDEDRKKNADFTDPYFLAAQSIVVKVDSPIASKADLAGKNISVQTGTTAEKYCLSNNYNVSAFEANNDAFSALTSGKVDAWVVDNEVAVKMIEGDATVKMLDEAMTTEPYGFAFQKGSTDLAKHFSDEINAMIDDGTMKAIFDKYDVPYVSPKQ